MTINQANLKKIVEFFQNEGKLLEAEHEKRTLVKPGVYSFRSGISSPVNIVEYAPTFKTKEEWLAEMVERFGAVLEQMQARSKTRPKFTKNRFIEDAGVNL